MSFSKKLVSKWRITLLSKKSYPLDQKKKKKTFRPKKNFYPYLSCQIRGSHSALIYKGKGRFELYNCSIYGSAIFGSPIKLNNIITYNNWWRFRFPKLQINVMLMRINKEMLLKNLILFWFFLLCCCKWTL